MPDEAITPIRCVNGWVSVEFVGAAAGQVVETVFTYECSSQPTESELIAFLSDWRTRMVPYLQAYSSNGLVFNKLVAKTHSCEFANVGTEYSFTGGTTGNVTGDLQAGNVTIATKLMTGVLGRRRRGRQFVPGLSENSTTGNQAGNALLAALASLFVQHLLGFSSTGITYTPAIKSLVIGEIHSVLSFSIEQFLDSMRRRLTGRGN
jgi:hypothetical protein